MNHACDNCAVEGQVKCGTRSAHPCSIGGSEIAFRQNFKSRIAAAGLTREARQRTKKDRPEDTRSAMIHVRRDRPGGRLVRWIWSDSMSPDRGCSQTLPGGAPGCRSG